MMIYLPIIRTYQAATGFGTEELLLPVEDLLQRMTQALAGKNTVLLGLWGVLLLLALVSMSVRWSCHWRSATGKARPSLEIYCLTALVLGIAAGMLFLKRNGNLPHPWHFVPFIVFAAVILEVGLRRAWNSFWLTAVRLIAACSVLGMSFFPLWTMSHLRRTNMDLVIWTAVVQSEPGDLILVNPFWMLSSFCHYYDGKSDWITIPAFPHDEMYSVTDGGPIRKLTHTSNPLEATKREITNTLANGRRLWIIGNIPFLEPGQLPPSISPAPDPHFGSSLEIYSEVWSLQTVYFLRQHALRVEEIPIPINQPVNEYEDLYLIRVDGWR